MKEMFIPYELAVKLKDKGFKWDRIITYNPRTNVRYNHIEPTISQVLKWLREEENVVVSMYPYYGKDVNTFWCWDVRTPVNRVDVCNHIKQDGFNSYEQAALAGIEYVLENLI